MIKYNLKCKNKHEFEGWFSDSKEFEKLNLDGFKYNLITQEWKKTKDCSVNYILVAKKT